MKSLIKRGLILLLLFMYAPFIYAGTVTINPLADTFIRSGEPNSNFGSIDLVAVGYSTTYGKYRSMVKFNLSSIPSGAKIKSAKFGLYYRGYSGSPNERWTDLYRITNDWSESTATWNNMSSNHSIGNYGGIYVGGSAICWEIWEGEGPTKLVQEWYHGTYTNYGLMLICSSETGLDTNVLNLNSKEKGTNTPYLEVTYNLPPTKCGTPSPSNNATNVDPKGTLSWTCKDPDDNPIKNYHLKLSKNQDLSSPIIDEWITTPFYKINLEKKTTYYWKVWASDGEMTQTDADLWKFTTGIDPGPFKVSGIFMYEDRPYTINGFIGYGKYEPVKYALVNVFEQGSKTTVIGTGNTNSMGNFDIKIDNNIDNPNETPGRDIFVRCYSRSYSNGYPDIYAANVKNLNSSVYEYDSITKDNWEGGDLSFGTFQIKIGTTAAAFNILDVITDGYEWVSGSGVNFPNKPPEVGIYWPDNSRGYSFYRATDDTIHLTHNAPNPEDNRLIDSSEYDDGVILHEYGHFLMDQYSYDHSPGGAHGWTDRADSRLAWSEGWASFIACVANNDPEHYVNNYMYDNFPRAWGIDIERVRDNYGNSPNINLGKDNEGLVAGTLWDINDYNNDGKDTLSVGSEWIWDVIDDYITNSMRCDTEDFWKGWFSQNHNHGAQVWDIFMQHGMQLDTNPPQKVTNLNSTSHTPWVISKNPYVNVAWTHALDAESGIGNYSVTWSLLPLDTPDTQAEFGPLNSTTGPYLTDTIALLGWWFHIRASDRAGNWGATEHYGPFLIDTTPPVAQLVPESVPVAVVPNVPFHLAMIITDPNNISKVTVDLISINGPKEHPLQKEGDNKWGCDITVPEGIGGKKDLIVTAIDTINNTGTATVTLNISGPEITSIIPTTGTIGTIVTIQGEKYLATEQIRIDFGTTKSIAITKANEIGSWTATFTIDSQSSGIKTITATGISSGKLAKSNFTILIPKISEVTPTSGIIGTKVTIKGEGYLQGEQICIDFGMTKSIAIIKANEIGSWTATFTIDSQSSGIKTITATGISSGKVAKSNFTILIPKISEVTPTSGIIGTKVTIKGEGYLQGEQICIDFGMTKSIAIIKANGIGSWTATFTIDSQFSGIKTITATGISSGGVAKSCFTILIPKISEVIPISGIIDTKVTIKGEGYFASEQIRIDFGTTKSIAIANTNEIGSWTAIFTIDSQPSGIKTITATGISLGGVAKSCFTILIPKISEVIPISGIIGTKVTIKGEGYFASEQIRIDFGTTKSIAIINVNAVGSFTATFTVDSQSYGTKSIIATGLNSGYSVTATFIIVLPYYSVSITPVSAGRYVSKGGTATYYYKVNNNGNLIDSYNLSTVNSKNGWVIKCYEDNNGLLGAQIGVNTGYINPGNYINIFVVINAPHNAILGDVNISTITVTSNGNPNVSAIIKENTTIGHIWSMYQHDMQQTGRSSYYGPSQPKLKWKYTTENRILSSPAISIDGIIYVGSYDGNLYAINSDGSLKWKYPTINKEFIYSSPAIDRDGTIYVGSHDKNLYAITPDGKLKWRYICDDFIHSSPVIGGDGTIYIGSYVGTIYAINSNGSLKWKYTAGGKNFFSSLAIDRDGSIYVSLWNNIYFYAINPNGTLKWRYYTGELYNSSPAISADGTIYIVKAGISLEAITPDGKFKWNYKGGFYSIPPVIGPDGTIYTYGSGNLYAINPAGNLKWKCSITCEWADWAIDAEGTIFISAHSSGNAYFYAITSDGNIKWKYPIGIVNQGLSSPAIDSDGTIYVGSHNNLYAITQGTCRITFITPTSGTIGTSVTVKGEGYDSSEPIRIDFGKTSSIAIVSANNVGSFTVTFTIDVQSPGTKTITATGLISNVTTFGIFNILDNTPPTITNPQSTPDIVSVGNVVKLTTKVTDEGSGVNSVTINLNPINGSATQVMFDNGTYGDEVVNDGTYTYQATIQNSVTGGLKNLAVTAMDNASNISKGTITLRVIKITSIIPASGTIGTIVTIQGEGYLPTEQIRIDFGLTKSIAMVGANELGSVTATFTVDFQSWGTKTITITGLSSNAIATATFKIIDITPPTIINPQAKPEVVNIGNAVKFTTKVTDEGSGVNSVTINLNPINGPDSQVMFDNGIYGDEVANDGTYTYQATIQNSVTGGLKNLAVTAMDNASNISKGTITLRVINPKITSVLPASGTIGTVVTVKGEGYLPTEQIRIDFGMTKSIAMVVANELGSVTASFTVDSQPIGLKTISVTGLSSNAIATATFEIIDKTPPIITNPQAIPNIVNIGEQVKFTAKVIDEGSGVKSVTIDLSAIGGSSDQLMNDTSAGTYTYTATIPTFISAGIKNLIITAKDNADNIGTISITLKVINPKITSVLPASGTIGTIVTLKGEGYLATEQIRIDFGMTKSIAIVGANELGSVTATFTVDFQSWGTKTITITGLSSNAIATATFKIIDITPPTITNPQAKPEVINIGNAVKFTAKVMDDLSRVKSVIIDISPIGGSANQGMYDDGTYGDEVANDGTYTYQATIPNSVSWGLKNLGITAMDNTSNISQGTITLRVINPKITSVIPISGTIGTIVTLKGEGYLPTEQIRIDFGINKSIAVTVSNSDGSFSTTFKVDSQIYGLKTITTTGVTSGGIAKSNFTILISQITSILPPSGTIGIDVTIKGGGYLASEQIRIDFGTTKSITVTLSDANGSFTATFKVDSQDYGLKTISATGVSSGGVAESTFKIINPKITLISPTFGTIGTIVTIRGTMDYPTSNERGFQILYPVCIDFGTTRSIAITLEYPDGFSTTFTVDSQPYGLKTITATWLFLGHIAKSTFMIITPKITSVLPTSGTIGTQVTIKGGGYLASEQIRIDFGATKSMAIPFSDANGNFTTTFKVNSQGYGTNIITATGVTSGGVTKSSFTIILSPPSTPTGLKIIRVYRHTGCRCPQYLEVTLNWNRNPEPDVVRYNVYKNGNKIQSVVSPYCSLRELQNGIVSYAVTAVNKYGRESSQSQVVKVVTYDSYTYGLYGNNNNIDISLVSISGNTVKFTFYLYPPIPSGGRIDRWKRLPIGKNQYSSDDGTYIDNSNGRLVIKARLYKGKGESYFNWRYTAITRGMRTATPLSINLDDSDDIINPDICLWLKNRKDEKFTFYLPSPDGINSWERNPVGMNKDSYDDETYIDHLNSMLVINAELKGKWWDPAFFNWEYRAITIGTSNAFVTPLITLRETPYSELKPMPKVKLTEAKSIRGILSNQKSEQEYKVAIMIKDVEEELTRAKFRISFDPGKVNVKDVQPPIFKDTSLEAVIENRTDNTVGVVEIDVSLIDHGWLSEEDSTIDLMNNSVDGKIQKSEKIDEEEKNIAPIAYLSIDVPRKSKSLSYQKTLEEIMDCISIDMVELKDADENIIEVKIDEGNITKIQPELSLDKAYSYPNPTKEGWIKFAKLTQAVKVRIFNIAGELVYEREHTTNGEWTWPCVNNDSKKVASGIYIYILQDPVGGSVKKGKIGVIR